MNRKNPFIMTLFCLMAGICFWITSCSSGLEEKGSVTFSFSDDLMNRIMSRAIDDDGETDIPLFEDAVMRYYGTNDKESDTYLLVLNQDNTYFIYSSKIAEELAEKMQEEIASDFSGMEEFENLSEEDIANGNYNEALYAEYLEKIKKYQEMGNNPYAFYEEAIISGGSWEGIDSVFKLTEKCYYNGTSLDEVSSPTVIATIEPDIAPVLITDSKYGTKMFFYSYESGNGGNGHPDKDDYHESDKHHKLNNPKIKITVDAGRRYEKEIDITYNITEDEKLVFNKAETRMDNLPLGANATVTVEFIWNDTVFVKGIRDFVIEQETEVNVTLRFAYSKIPEEFYFPEEIDNPDEQPVYYAQCLIPEEYREKFNGGWLYFYANKDKTYEIFADIYDDDLRYSESKTYAKGTWDYDEKEDNAIRLIEEYYYDFATDKLIAVDEYDYNTVIYLSASGFLYNGTAIPELQFKNPEMSSLDYEYDLDFTISGIKDVSDFDTGLIKIYYALDDYVISESIKSLEKITSDEVSTLLSRGDVYELMFSNRFSIEQSGLSLSTQIFFQGKQEKPIYFFAVIPESGSGTNTSYTYIGITDAISLSPYSNSVKITLSPVGNGTVSGNGGITIDNNAWVIHLDKTSFTTQSDDTVIAVQTENGINVDKKMNFTVQILYKGKSIKDVATNEIYGEDQKEIKGCAHMELFIDEEDEQPFTGSYQLYVTACDSENEMLYCSQYFDITITEE